MQGSYDYIDFNKFQRLEDMSINDYLPKSEQLNDRMIQFDLKLPFLLFKTALMCVTHSK